jgi:iron complex transport system substrate-binding protein
MATYADRFPKKIICLTEEPVETLYLLGESQRIAGVSVFVQRPPEAKKEKPIVSAFTHANLEKILAIKPDLVIGHSDIQKDIARELIAAGIDVWISNHRSLEQVLDYIVRLGSLVGRFQDAQSLVNRYQLKMERIQEKFAKRDNPVRVYLEEWDEPMICGIRWFSELVQLFGVTDIFSEKSCPGSLAKNRFVSWEQVLAADPHYFFACWYGKKVDFDSIKNRPGAASLTALRSRRIHELDPSLFLQPGPALFEGGIDVLERLLNI